MSYFGGAPNRTKYTLNASQEAFGNIQMAEHKMRDRKTYCSSAKCNGFGNGNRKGKLVHVGLIYLDSCPSCGSNMVFHE